MNSTFPPLLFSFSATVFACEPYHTGSYPSETILMFMWNFFLTIFPVLMFSRLVLRNWKQNGETPFNSTEPLIDKPVHLHTHSHSRCGVRGAWWGERSTSDGQCRREFPETFSWCDVCQQNWPNMGWRMYVNTETILRWDVTNVK